MNIGRRIYYEKASGDVVLDTGERSGDVVVTTPDEDFVSYSELADRDRASVEFIEVEYGVHGEEFKACKGCRINIVTGAIEFF